MAADNKDAAAEEEAKAEAEDKDAEKNEPAANTLGDHRDAAGPTAMARMQAPDA